MQEEKDYSWNSGKTRNMNWNSLKILNVVSLLPSVLLLLSSPTLQISFPHIVGNMVVTNSSQFYILLPQAPETAFCNALSGTKFSKSS